LFKKKRKGKEKWVMTGRFDTSRATVYLSEGYALFYYFQFAVR